MKVNKIFIVSVILLAILSLGAASAADDIAANELAVDDAGNFDLEVPAGDEITADGDGLDDVAIGDNVNDDKLGATQDDELSVGTVAPTYTYDFNLPKPVSYYYAQWGQPIYVSANYGNATGNVTVTFGGDSFTKELVNGSFDCVLTKYTKASTEQFRAKYTGDDYYSSATFSQYVYVQLEGVVVNPVIYGEKAVVDVNLYEATGNVSFTLNGVTYKKELVDGKATQEFGNYTLATNTISFAYEGDGKYNGITKSLTFTPTVNITPSTIYDFQSGIIAVNLGEATGNVTFTWGNITETVELTDGIATFDVTNYSIGVNSVEVSYSGDNNYKEFSTIHKLTVLAKEDPTILSSVYKTADKNMIIINIPYATGNVTVVINGKKEVLELGEGGIVTYNINANDVITEINVTYGGDVRFNPGNSSKFINYTDYIVNNETWKHYFNQMDYGKLYEFVEPGATLDFQGSITNPDMNNPAYMDISIPVNIISSTNDGLVNLNSPDKYAVSPIIKANSFMITRGGSWSNITGITIYNTQVWLTNTSHVVLDRINITCAQKIGSGTGHTAIRDNTTYLTLKNSYIYSWNTGSSGFVLTWADYCTFDNNTFAGKAGGNFMYFFAGSYTGTINTNNTFINNRIGDGINVVGFAGSGPNTVFVNNTFSKISCPAGVYVVGNVVNGGGISIGANGIGYDNYATGSLSAGTNAVAYNNTALGKMTVGEKAEVFNNSVGGLNLAGADSLVHNNIINGATTVQNSLGATNCQIYSNVFIGDNTITLSTKAINITFLGNDIIGNIEFSNKNAINNKIVNNTITTSKDYAVNLKTFKGTENIITGNVLYSKLGFGNDAVNTVDDTVLLNNSPDTPAEIIISVKDIKVGENAVFNVTTNVTSIASATVIVDGKKYTVDLVNGKGSVEVADLLYGKYDVTVTSDDLKYGAQNATSFTVDKNMPPRIAVDAPAKTQWIDSNITVTIRRATGTVTLDINGTKITEELVNSVATFAGPDFVPGSYDYNITYSGDFKYEGGQTNGTLTVNKNKQVIIVANDVEVDVIADKFTAKFTNYIGEAIANANVTVTVDGVTYPKVTDENGTVTVDFVLTRGQYGVNIEFKAIPDEYDAASAKYTITVIDASIMKIVSVDGEGIIIGSLTDAIGIPLANAAIIATMDGIETNLTTGSDGLFKFQAKNGCEASFVFEGDTITTLSGTSITLNNVAHILKESAFNISDVSVVAVDTAAGEAGKAYTFTLKDAQDNALANKTVHVTLNGEEYDVVTDENGTASVVVSLNVAKTYNLNAFFIGDDDYKGAVAAAKITVTKKATTLKAAKTKYTFKAKAKSKVIKATLKTSNKYLKAGKKVTIKIKGKTYTAKTGKNGAIKLNIKALSKKGTYKAKIKFAGDSTYKASSSSNIKIVIK